MCTCFFFLIESRIKSKFTGSLGIIGLRNIDFDHINDLVLEIIWRS